jgi:hypothetical protein
VRYSRHMQTTNESVPAVPTPRKTPYVSVNLTIPARDALQQLTFEEQARAGRRLALSPVLLAAITVARRYPDELSAMIDSPESEEE